MEKHEAERIAAAYDRWSESYDVQANETRDLDEMVLRRVAPDLSGRTVVECGCGTGKNSVWLAERCARLIGLDFSAGMLKIAKAKVGSPKAMFMLQDIRLPWAIADASANVVLFNLVLEHIEDLEPVFREASRVLLTGGQMALSEYHPSRVSSGKGPVVKGEDGAIEFRIPNYLHALDDYQESAHRAGLTLVSTAEWSATELGYRGDATDARPQLISMLFRRQ